jgi:hypothetical protein
MRIGLALSALFFIVIVDVILIIVRAEGDLFFFIVLVEATAQIVVFYFIGEVVIFICGCCMVPNRVVERHCHFPSSLL